MSNKYAEPTLTSVISAGVQYHMANMHTAMPGRVEEFYSSDMTADIKPCLTIRQGDGTFLEYPVLTKVPIVHYRTSKMHLTYPLSAGDYGLIIYMEGSMDAWHSTGGVSNPTVSAKWDLADAVFIPGLHPVNMPASASQADDSASMELVLNGSGMRVNKDGAITIGTEFFKALIHEEFKILFNSHTHAYVPGSLIAGTYPVVPVVPGGPDPVAPPSQPMTDKHMTTKTKAN